MLLPPCARSRRASWLVVIVAALVAACQRRTAPSPPGAGGSPVFGEGGSPVSPNEVAEAAEPADAAPFEVSSRPGHRACRVMSLDGQAMMRLLADTHNTAGEPAPVRAPVPGTLLPDDAVLDLLPNTRLTVQSTASGRAFSLTGPATLEACPGGDEAARLALGKLSAVPGSGVRPGSEVWIATPLGVIRFSDAKIDIEVSTPGNRVAVMVASGHALFVPGASVRGASDAAILGDTALSPGAMFRADRAPMSRLELVRRLVLACARNSDEAEAAGREVADANARTDAALGERAFAHVRARQRARAACEIARAASLLETGILKPPLSDELAAAEAKWKQLTPSPARR